MASNVNPPERDFHEISHDIANKRNDVVIQKIKNDPTLVHCVSQASKLSLLKMSMMEENYRIFHHLLDLMDHDVYLTNNVLYDRDSYTSIMFSMVYGTSEITKQLIQKFRNINEQDKLYKRTALHVMIKYDPNSIEQLKVLLENGADVTIRDKYGRTPKEYAMKHPIINKAIIELLEEHEQKQQR